MCSAGGRRICINESGQLHSGKYRQFLKNTDNAHVIKSVYNINPQICSDTQGPDCSKLRLGDDYLTTSKPDIKDYDFPVLQETLMQKVRSKARLPGLILQ